MLGKIPQRAFPAGALPLYLFAPEPFIARVTTLRAASVDVRLRGAFPAPEARRSRRARGVEASRAGDHDCMEPRHGLAPAPLRAACDLLVQKVSCLNERMTTVGTRRVRSASARGWKRWPLDASLHDLAAPSITVRPERTLHTFFAFRVVNAFLMRAADDAINGRHRFGTVMIDESNDCFSDFWIASRIGCFAKPPLNGVRVSIFVRDDANRDLRRSRVVWPVEGNRCHRIATEAFATFFRKLAPLPLSLECHDPSLAFLAG